MGLGFYKVSGLRFRAEEFRLLGFGVRLEYGFIEIVKGLGAKNVLSESFDRNVLSRFPD